MEQSQASSQSELEANQNLLIQSCFQKTPALGYQQLHAWCEEYKAVPANILDAQHTIIQAVQADPLDQNAIEQCILSLATNITISGRFCSECSHLFSHWPDLGAGRKHAVARVCHTLLLEAATRKGCSFCAFLMQMIRDAGLLDTFRRIEARMVWLGDAGKEKRKEKTSLSVYNWGMSTGQFLWINFPGKVCQNFDSGVAQEMIIFSHALGATEITHYWERDVLDIAKEWLDDCAKGHETCNKDQGNTLPTRLVSIAGDELKLVNTAGWQTKPRYSTLSHCWGNETFFKLTKENHEALHTVIPDQELPKTFKDAVYISQQLEIGYLWIDSLCIIQGDTEDWRREAALMSSVYGNSFINIAAASAVNAYEGCFLKRPYLVDGLRAQISTGGFTLVRDFHSSSVYSLATTDSHLATRAWALQEKILPPRTIHFGNRGAFWECRKKVANEFLPGGFSWEIRGLNGDSHRRHFNYWWSKIVSLYSAANLTFSRDKLPALSGVARRSYEERGGQYIAGIWRDKDIEAQLCWHAMNPRLRPAWRAPSWSWMSIDGKVFSKCRWKDINHMQDTYAHVFDVNIELLGQDPFGEVRSGYVSITCSGMLAATPSQNNTVRFDSDSAADDVYPIRPDCINDKEEKDSGSVYLLPLIGGETGNSSLDETEKICKSESAILGLVLKRQSDVTGHFCRVGIFEFFRNPMDRDGEEEHLDPFLEALRQRGELVASSVCEEVAGDEKDSGEKYVVRIF